MLHDKYYRVPNLPALPLAEQIGYETLHNYQGAVEDRGPLGGDKAAHFAELAWANLESGLAAKSVSPDNKHDDAWAHTATNHFEVARDFAGMATVAKKCSGESFVSAMQLQNDLPLFFARRFGQVVPASVLAESDTQTAELLAAIHKGGTQRVSNIKVPRFDNDELRRSAAIKLGAHLLYRRAGDVSYVASYRERSGTNGTLGTNHDFYGIIDSEKLPIKGGFRMKRHLDGRVSMLFFKPLLQRALRELDLVPPDESIKQPVFHKYTEGVLHALVRELRGEPISGEQRTVLDTITDISQATLVTKRGR